MRFRPVSQALIAGTLLFLPSSARSDVIYETDYLSSGSVLLPTSTVVSSSYLLPTTTTSYLSPTSYVLPTSYVATSSVFAPDILDQTSYVRTYRSSVLRPRRFVEKTSYIVSPRYALAPTSYVVPTTTVVSPTSYVLPTRYVSSTIVPTSYVVGSPLIATSLASSSPCEETSAPLTPTLTPTPTSTTRNEAPRPLPPVAPAERQPSGVMQSTPSNESHEPAVAEPPMTSSGATPTNRSTVPVPAAPTTPLDPGPAKPTGTPPEPDFPEIPKPGESGPSTSLPQDNSLPERRDSYKSIYSSPNRPDFRPPVQSRNVLRGRVMAFDTGKPEEGVTVYLTSRTGAFSDRTTQTDADGHFAVTLPDGDWAVKVRMPSGNVRSVGSDDVTASAGRIMDAAGRGVSEFVITR
ncbi:carboxypeptidase regulatory-like domain-containing protein [Tundrisphaera sp. TA3]|uniref:carboxypeptidase regulatory-like domain-containing protein n=1 Tax=Tundrisphaera sp. TA3 TaxID=3435775 RepID=UPI003EB79882